MKLAYNLIAIGIFILISAGCQDIDTNNENCGIKENHELEPGNYKILFIGNSHTYTFNVPQTVKELAKVEGNTIVTSMEAPGGYSLKQHSVRKQTLDAINSQKWDFVVLQESGAWGAVHPHAFDTVIYKYAKVLTDLIWLNSTETKVVWYMTHAYKHGVLTFNDYNWCMQDSLVCQYDGMQDRVRDNYMRLEELIESEVAPSGIMWKIFMDAYSEIDLYKNDALHANALGSYIAAYTIYSIIFKKRSENIYYPEELTKQEAKKIQNVVSNSLFDCEPNWEIY